MNEKEWKKEYIYTDEELEMIAHKHGLHGKRKQLFLAYIKERNFIRKDYYTEEWAERFASGSEWERSDLVGQGILKKLIKKIYNIDREEWKCPRCKRTTIDFPAISRKDNKTEICSACGTDEALIDLANRSST